MYTKLQFIVLLSDPSKTITLITYVAFTVVLYIWKELRIHTYVHMHMCGMFGNNELKIIVQRAVVLNYNHICIILIIFCMLHTILCTLISFSILCT